MSSSDRTTRSMTEDDYELRSALRKLPVRVAPPQLGSQLRVIASRELARNRTRSSVGAFSSHLLEHSRLWCKNLMRPLAIPTAGGFVSALFLFTMLAHSITAVPVSSSSATGSDVPTGLYTEASIRSVVPLGYPDQEIDVELTIDGQGRIVDYQIPNAKHLSKSSSIRRAIENNLLFTQFYPATSFGQPMTGKVRLSFRSSRIDVKG